MLDRVAYTLLMFSVKVLGGILIEILKKEAIKRSAMVQLESAISEYNDVLRWARDDNGVEVRVKNQAIISSARRLLEVARGE